MRQRIRNLLWALVGIAIAGIGYSALARSGYGIPCLVYTITGLRCPGCGISRSLAAMLTFDVTAFLHYNLLTPLIILYLLWVGTLSAIAYVRHGIWQYRTPCQWIDASLLVVFILWGVLRNVWGI